MILFPITEETSIIFSLCLQHPVFKSIVKDYSIDEKYLYIPERQFPDKKLMKQLIDEGYLIRQIQD